jgi:hypothetical protein
VIAKALALAPRDRWKSASELLEALDAARAPRPLPDGDAAIATATSTGNPPVAGRRARPRIWLIVLGAAAALSIIGAVWRLSGTRKPRPSEQAAVVMAPLNDKQVTAEAAAPATPVASSTAEQPQPAPAPPAAEVVTGAHKVRSRRAAKKDDARRGDVPPRANDDKDLFNDTK